MREEVSQKASGILVYIEENPERVEGMHFGTLVVMPLEDMYEYLVSQELETRQVSEKVDFSIDQQCGFSIDRSYKTGAFAEIPKPLNGLMDKSSWLRETINYIEALPEKEIKAV